MRSPSSERRKEEDRRRRGRQHHGDHHDRPHRKDERDVDRPPGNHLRHDGHGRADVHVRHSPSHVREVRPCDRTDQRQRAEYDHPIAICCCDHSRSGSAKSEAACERIDTIRARA